MGTRLKLSFLEESKANGVAYLNPEMLDQFREPRRNFEGFAKFGTNIKALVTTREDSLDLIQIAKMPETLSNEMSDPSGKDVGYCCLSTQATALASSLNEGETQC